MGWKNKADEWMLEGKKWIQLIDWKILMPENYAIPDHDYIISKSEV